MASVSSSRGSITFALVTGMRTLNAPHTWRKLKPGGGFSALGAGPPALVALRSKGNLEGALCSTGGGWGGGGRWPRLVETRRTMMLNTSPWVIVDGKSMVSRPAKFTFGTWGMGM